MARRYLCIQYIIQDMAESSVSFGNEQTLLVLSIDNFCKLEKLCKIMSNMHPMSLAIQAKSRSMPQDVHAVLHKKYPDCDSFYKYAPPPSIISDKYF